MGETVLSILKYSFPKDSLIKLAISDEGNIRINTKSESAESDFRLSLKGNKLLL